MAIQELLKDVTTVLNQLQLNEVYGVTEGMHKAKSGKTAPALTFCKARILDGQVVVWGPKFIQVQWRTAIRSLPERHSQIYKSYDEFKQGMEEYFGKYVH